MREKPRKQAKDIHNSLCGPDSILSQVPPESRPDWEQCPNMGSVGFVCLMILEKFCPYLFYLWPHPTQVSKDDRSDVESSSEEEDMTSSTKGPCGRSSSNGAGRVNGHMGGSYWLKSEVVGMGTSA